MAFQIKYARLFECRLWHGYYLHQGNRQNFHNLDINNATDLISIQHILSRYDLKKIFDITPFKETTKIMAGRRMKIAYDNTGFFIGISVTPTADPQFYEPSIPFDNTLKLHFGLRLANPGFFAQITNERMQTNLPAIYYFTNLLPNDSDYADSSLSTISRQYPDYQNRRYEMGEMVHDGSDLYRSIEADNTGVGLSDPSVWETIPLPPPLPNNNFDNRFEVNNNDRVLLPTRFNYTFTPHDGINITTATIILEDLSGNPIQNDAFSLTPGQTQVPLNYSDISAGWYRLNTSGSGGYATSHLVYLNDELYDRNLWGVVEIGHDSTLSASNSIRRILESDGSLRHTLTETETPIFNIRIPNRYTYWRYKPHPAQAPLTPSNTADVNLINNLLESKQQQPNTQFGVQISYINQGGTAVILLPNPVVDICRPEADGRIYSDVHLGLIPI